MSLASCDQRAVGEDRVAAGHAKRDPVMPIALLDLSKAAADDLFRLIYQDNVVTEPFGSLHQMRREDDGLFLLAKLAQNIDHELHIDRIEAREGLIKYQKVGVVQHRRDKLYLLLHSFRKVRRFLVLPFRKVHPPEPKVDAFVGLGPRNVLQRSKIPELIDDLHLFVKAAFLGQITYPVLQPRPHLLAE